MSNWNSIIEMKNILHDLQKHTHKENLNLPRDMDVHLKQQIQTRILLNQ